jgi:hypothetical protein
VRMPGRLAPRVTPRAPRAGLGLQMRER